MLCIVAPLLGCVKLHARQAKTQGPEIKRVRGDVNQDVDNQSLRIAGGVFGCESFSKVPYPSLAIDFVLDG